MNQELNDTSLEILSIIIELLKKNKDALNDSTLLEIEQYVVMSNNNNEAFNSIINIITKQWELKNG